MDVAGLLVDMFKDRILPFDTLAAQQYAMLMRQARRTRISISIHNAQNVAIARVRNMIVASGNASPFLAAGLPVIDPWVF